MVPSGVVTSQLPSSSTLMAVPSSRNVTLPWLYWPEAEPQARSRSAASTCTPSLQETPSLMWYVIVSGSSDSMTQVPN